MFKRVHIINLCDIFKYDLFFIIFVLKTNRHLCISDVVRPSRIITSISDIRSDHEIHHIAKSIHSLIHIIEFRCSKHFNGHRCIELSRYLDFFYKKLWKNGFLSGALLNQAWYCKRILTVVEVQLQNVLTIYSTVTCNWSYIKVEVIRTTVTQPRSCSHIQLQKGVSLCCGLKYDSVTSFL